MKLSRISHSPATLPNLNLDSLFQILGTALQDIHEDAERIVREHVKHIDNSNAEHWISQGQQLARKIHKKRRTLLNPLI
jgi:wobble nucleotide-excising tRNase